MSSVSTSSSTSSQPRLSVVLGYYNDAAPLARRVSEWKAYPAPVLRQTEFVVVDDGSQTQPLTKAKVGALVTGAPGLRLVACRINRDVGWNNHGARNVGAFVAQGKTLLMLDMDCVLTPAQMTVALAASLDLDGKTALYFARALVTAPRVPIKPSPNMFLITRAAFWRMGGYNEDLTGFYGTDKEFKSRMAGFGIVRRVDRRVSLLVDMGAAQAKEAKRVPRTLPRHRKTSEDPLRLGWVRVAHAGWGFGPPGSKLAVRLQPQRRMVFESRVATFPDIPRAERLVRRQPWDVTGSADVELASPSKLQTPLQREVQRRNMCYVAMPSDMPSDGEPKRKPPPPPPRVPQTPSMPSSPITTLTPIRTAAPSPTTPTTPTRILQLLDLQPPATPATPTTTHAKLRHSRTSRDTRNHTRSLSERDARRQHRAGVLKRVLAALT